MTPSVFDLSGRRAVVTGSSRGIGAALAVGLAEAGADVAVNYAGSAEAAQAVSDRIAALGRRTTVIQADFSQPGAGKHVVDETLACFGGLDLVISNVAVQFAEPWHDVSSEHFEHQVRTNWQSAFDLIQAATPGMIERGFGRIITIGSVQEAKPHPDMVVYAALKSAQTAMVRNLARQLAPHGVTVNNVAPGVISTDRSTPRLADKTYADKVLGAIPAGRFGQPGDCVAPVLMLCSDQAGYITGQNLFVDGGMSL